jgi:hypothetical protein
MTIGIAPITGFQPVDSDWLNGLSGGHNLAYVSGITAAGTNQATATQLPDRVSVIEVDTTASGTGVALPAALQGMRISLYNNGANTLEVYPAIANNPVTGSQDTINNAASATLATHVGATYACAKNGVWFAA